MCACFVYAAAEHITHSHSNTSAEERLVNKMNIASVKSSALPLEVGPREK